VRHGAFYQRIDFGFLADVALDEQGVAARSADLLGDFFAQVGAAAGEHDFGAFFGEDLGNGHANALCGAGYDSYFVG
jgi:hypothetical protein